MRTALILGWVLLCVAAGDALAAEEGRCQAHVILFVPADVTPPKAYQGRIDQIAAYTESFLERELKRWGHQKFTKPFARAADGHVEVMLVQGKQKTSQYKPVAVRAEVMDGLRAENRLDGPRQIWWILVYAGQPPARFAGFLGGFGPQIGGWAVCNFDTTPGRIDPVQPLGSDFLESIMLKGMIHELGHGFGLPHIGPLDRDKAGNTLMGPTHANYKRVKGAGEHRVYLSEAEAAMLSTHPALRGGSDERGQLPKVEMRDMKYMTDAAKKVIVVSGQLAGSGRAVYALVADESEARPGEYWTKTYVGKVGNDGAFEVKVTEPAESDGTLKTWFAFENGALTGDGKERGRESGISRAYTYKGKRWVFD